MPKCTALAWVVAVSLAAMAPGVVEATAAGEPLNVLFMAVDDLNDWIGALGGHPQARTPHLDRLARRSVTFTSAHCQAPICNPSRVSLLTGVLPSSTGIYYLSPLLRQCEATRDAVTIPQHFERSGYNSWGVGKIYHVEGREEFAEYGGTFGGFGPKPKARFHYHLPDVPWTGTLTDWGAFPDVDEKMPDHQVADWAIDHMQDSTGYFYYRQLSWTTVKTPMLHWAHATTFKALCHLLSRLSA